MQLPRTLFALALLAGAAGAQAGGFVDGDLYLASRGITGIGSQDGGIVAIDPLSAHSEQTVDFAFSSFGRGVMAFDSYRKRLVFWTSIDQGGPQYGLWTANAAGQLEHIVPTLENMQALAPTGDGRLYVVTPSDNIAPFKWFDAANRKHVLRDADGVTAFNFSGIIGNADAVMTYHAATNALFIAYRGNSGQPCAGAAGDGITIKKLPLSADGTRVIGPVSCREFQSDLVQSQEAPSNWSRGPGGALLLVCDTPGVSTLQKPRVAAVEPLSFTVTTFASPGGFTGADQLTAGSWSSARGEVLLLDTVNDVLRGYTQGGSGVGDVFAVNGPLSSNPGSGEYATLVEVDTGDCAGGFQPVGVGLAGSGGLVPALTASGCASLGGQVTLQLADVRGGAKGLLFGSFSEGLLAFRGGTLFMGSVDVLLNIGVGGAAGVAGAGSATFPPLSIDNPGLLGAKVFVQAAFVDPAAVNGVSLTQAVRVEFE